MCPNQEGCRERCYSLWLEDIDQFSCRMPRLTWVFKDDRFSRLWLGFVAVVILFLLCFLYVHCVCVEVKGQLVGYRSCFGGIVLVFVFCFQPVGFSPGDQTQVIRLEDKDLNSLSHLASPRLWFLDEREVNSK